MILTNVEIKNFRCFKEFSLNIFNPECEEHFCGLIGENEVGKSSLLKALALKEDPILDKKDFYDRNKQVEISYTYLITYEELQSLTSDVVTKSLAKLERKFIPENYYVKLKLIIPSIAGIKEQREISLPENLIFSEAEERQACIKEVERLIPRHDFWSFRDQYLIHKPINIKQFVANPDSVSIPLHNCFKLAGFNNVRKIVDQLGDSTEREFVSERLGTKVTSYVSEIWKDHPIRITFNISDGHIHFHVRDNGVSKARTVDQRSDGFKQFISFLLSTSVQHQYESLNNVVLLIDEPETHLHPRAQLGLLEELKVLSKGQNTTILMSTHSNYLIDKGNLDQFVLLKKRGT